MSSRIPGFVSDLYGGAHKFRRQKRKAVVAMFKKLDDLMCGSAYLPEDGYQHAKAIRDSLRHLRAITTTRRWGR